MDDRPPWRIREEAHSRPKYYTGVGSRTAPSDVLIKFKKIAKRLAELKYTLRSGGAAGCDTAFEQGAGDNKDIYYATEYEAKKHNGDFVSYAPNLEEDPAYIMAGQVHDAWPYIKEEYVKLLHRRNVFQVLGPSLDRPSEFLLCWTPCGAENYAECVYDPRPEGIKTGGTATAIKIASLRNVPVFNLFKKGRFEEFCDFMKEKA